MTNNAIKIQQFHTATIIGSNVYVADANPKNEGEYEYAIFFSEKNYKNYLSNKLDNEDLIIWKTDGGQFGFSYFVDDANDFVEHPETFGTILKCICKLSNFFYEGAVNEAVTFFNET